MKMITGLFETHLNISNLERSMAFYGETLGLPFAYHDAKRRCTFYWIGGPKEAMLGLWEKPAEQVVRQHFAFRTTVAGVFETVTFLKERGIPCRNFLDDGTTRPFVFGWMPALAIYFRDPDGHSLECIAILPEPPQPELGVVSWETWQAHNQPSSTDKET